jgi:CRISPR type III-B/RAMP module-associated protein Cmr5
MAATREQDRAQAAFQLVSAVPGERRREYGGQALRLPALIHHCGLCQALVFLEAKAGGDLRSAHGLLLSHVALVSQLAGSTEELTEMARTADIRGYLRMTHEASASAEWLKRYAEALGFATPPEKG